MLKNEIVQLKSYDDKTGKEIGNVLPITNGEAVKVENDKNLKQKLTEITTNIEQTNVSLDKKANAIDLQVERNRIDLLTRVEKGETEGNTELLDIRNGANGEVYLTGGEMIRDIAKGRGILKDSIARNKTTFYTLYTEGNLISEEMNVYYYGFMYSVDKTKIHGDFPTIKLSIDDIDFINIPLQFNFDSHITFWDKDNNFLSGYIQGSLTNTNNTELLHNIPSNASYVLFGIYKSTLTDGILAKKENYSQQLKPQYQDDSLLITKDNLDTNIKFAKDVIEDIKLNPYGNLFDKNKLITNRYYDINGNLILTNGTHMAEININCNNSYTFNFESHITYWSENDTFINGYIQAPCSPDYPQKLINIPRNAVKVRMLVFDHTVNKAVFSLSSHFSNNLKCTYYIPGVISDIENNADKLYEYGNLLETSKLVKGLVNQNGVYDHTSNDYTTDFLEIKDYKFDFVSMISFWDNDKQFIDGYIAGSVSPQYPATLSNKPDNAKYVRFTVWAQDLDFAVLALTTTYQSNLKTYYYKENIISAQENINNALKNNPLFGKSFLFFGDSWCAGNASAPDGWSGWLKKYNPSITVKNCGIHGQDWEQAYNHWIVNQDNWGSLSNNYDYVILEAYTNGLYVDVDRLTKPLGNIDEFTYYTSDEHIINALGDTYAKDMELCLFNISKKWAGKKIGLMFPYKSVDMLREHNAFRIFREQVFKCCRKYNIPVFDNFDGCNIQSYRTDFVNMYFFENDGVHLNNLGYDIICPPIESWLTTI